MGTRGKGACEGGREGRTGGRVYMTMQSNQDTIRSD